MNKNLENICRVCLSSASRNIFEKSTATSDSQFSIPAIGENVSSLDRLVEKLRYVTMLKVDECENLPKNMCDSCIIQLNVAYNLKKNAIQSDMKLRQYMIEFGINVTSYTTCSINSINTVSVMHPPAMILPATTTSESVTITTAKTTVAPQPPPTQPPQPHRPFHVMPVIIKEEPVDYEVMSDITVETNREAFDEHMQNHRNRINGIHSTSSSASNKSTTPLPAHSMVSVNTKSLILAPQGPTDNEFISAYMKKPSSTSTTTVRSKKNSQAKSLNKQKNPERVYRPGPKSKVKHAAVTQNGNEAVKRRARATEADKLLKDEGTIRYQKDDANASTPKRQTRNQLKEPLGSDSSANRQQSRPRSVTKVDYKSFFFKTPVNGSTTPVNVVATLRMKRRLSMSGSGRPKMRSPTGRNPARPKTGAAVRKRRSSMSHNRPNWSI